MPTVLVETETKTPPSELARIVAASRWTLPTGGASGHGSRVASWYRGVVGVIDDRLSPVRTFSNFLLRGRDYGKKQQQWAPTANVWRRLAGVFFQELEGVAASFQRNEA